MKIIFPFLLVLLLGAAVGFFHHRFLRRPNLGGAWAAMAVAFFGAIIGAFAFDWILCRLMDVLAYVMDGLNWLMGNMDAKWLPPINLVAALLGAFLLVFIFHKVSPGRGDR